MLRDLFCDCSPTSAPVPDGIFLIQTLVDNLLELWPKVHEFFAKSSTRMVRGKGKIHDMHQEVKGL